jgi:hypothetical protein
MADIVYEQYPQVALDDLWLTSAKQAKTRSRLTARTVDALLTIAGVHSDSCLGQPQSQIVKRLSVARR